MDMNVSKTMSTLSTMMVGTEMMDVLNNTDIMNVEEEEDEFTEDLSLAIQASMAFIGFIGNTLTFITLRKNGNIFDPSVLKLIKNQAILDAIVCFMGSIYVLQPPMWKTHKSESLDRFICHAWHSQEFYWSNVITSVYNLVLIAFERFLAVCYPFKHADFTGKNVNKAIAGIYIYNYVFHTFCILQVSYRDGECVSQYLVEGQAGIDLFKFFGTWLLVFHYIGPAVCFLYFYGSVIYTLNKRTSQQDKLGASKIIEKANKQLTKTCIVVTIIFCITLGYDIVYYFLGRMGFVTYVKNSFIQKIGMFFSIFNSMANPIVYTILMPSYRRAVLSTIACKQTNPSSGSASVRSSTTNVSSVSENVSVQSKSNI